MMSTEEVYDNLQ